MKTTKRIAVVMSAAMSVATFALPTAQAADADAPAAPAQTDNQLNRAKHNAGDATNNAGDAVNNGAAAAGNAAEKTGDRVRTGTEHLVAGNPSADNPAPDAKDIRKSLGSLAKDALTKGGLNKVVSHFVDADRNRIKNSDTYSQDFGEKLDGRIEQINQAWKTKYGHEFKVKSADDAYSNFAMIRQGEIGRDATLASEVIRNSQSANTSDKDNTAGNDRKDENLEQGRQIAVVTVRPVADPLRGTAAPTSERELKVPLIHELPDSWKTNVPDSLTATRLRQSLLDHLTVVGDNVAQLPADENAAIQSVTRHILMAVLDQPVQEGAAQPMRPAQPMPGAAK